MELGLKWTLSAGQDRPVCGWQVLSIAHRNGRPRDPVAPGSSAAENQEVEDLGLMIQKRLL